MYHALLCFYRSLTLWLTKADFIALLMLRLVLAYGFYEPAIFKISDIGAIVVWFGQMGIPAFWAYVVSVIECLGVLSLLLGLALRLFTLLLSAVLIGAIYYLHFANGFRAYYNGYEIPLYYIVMLFVLLVKGAGTLSLDAYITKRWQTYKK